MTQNISFLENTILKIPYVSKVPYVLTLSILDVLIISLWKSRINDDTGVINVSALDAAKEWCVQ